MTKKLIVSTLTCLLLNSYVLKAQDPSFSQFYANLLYLNPAFAGSTKCPKISMNFRDQYPKMNHTFVTPSISFDKYINALQGGVGILIYNDISNASAATVNTMNISGMYSYSINVTKEFAVKTGFEVSYIQRSVNTSNITFPDMYNAVYGPVFQTNEELNLLGIQKNIFDFSVGAIGFTKKYYFGMAVNYLTQPTEKHRDQFDTYLSQKYTLHLGAKYKLNQNSSKKGETVMSPNIIFQKQANSLQLSYGAYVNNSSLILGVFLRHNFKFNYESAIFVIGYEQSKYKVAYSYDLTLSKLKGETLGAHEISISTELNCNQKKKKFKTINCPNFS